MLVRSGVENITIIDFDKVEQTNLNRQIIATKNTVGMFKTDAMEERIKSINPNSKVVNIKQKLEETNMASYIKTDFDFVVDAIDIVKDKLALIKYCYDNNINIVSSMGTGNRFSMPSYYITDINKTSGDGLAKVLRKKLKEMKIKKLKVCISKTLPSIKTREPLSISYQPAVCWLRFGKFCGKLYYRRIKMEQITQEQFKEKVLNSNKKVLVDFFATWCPPCRALAPILENIAEEHEEYEFFKLNVDENEDISREYGIMSIPTLMVFENGKLLKRETGLRPKNEVLKLLED